MRTTHSPSESQNTLKVSVIVPTLNEELALKDTLSEVSGYSPYEVIVADGGSEDNTLDIARQFTDRIVVCDPGRAVQMNAGARTASGDLFLFLHADSRVDAHSYRKMIEVMQDQETVGGAFSLAIESDHWFLRLISILATLRARYLHLVYGDQAIFVRSSTFRSLGGFSSLPICEDLDFFRRLRKQGPVILLEEKALTSARRWLADGIFFTSLRNLTIAALFLLRFPPRILSKWYLVIR